MDDKKYFLEKLFEMFHIYGVKTLTMDDIAKEFSISKKTLYQKYSHKENLICDVLDFMSKEGLDENEKYPDNTLIIVYRIYSFLYKLFHPF